MTGSRSGSKRAGEPRALLARLAAPFGEITVVETKRGVLAIELEPLDQGEISVRLARRLGAKVELELAPTLRSLAPIEQYLSGTRRHLDVPVDLSGIDGFLHETLVTLARVPFGTLVTYGELAARLGRPGAARAIGGAMAKNPIPIVVPCHRVVAADGSLGGFSGGLDIKRWLHAHEGIASLPGGWSTRAERVRAKPHSRQRRSVARSSRSTRT